MIFNLILESSIYTVFFVTAVIIFIAFEGGRFLGKKHQKTAGQEDRSPINSIVAASLGLLAFLLAFTFGIVVSKMDQRRELVLDEANAIGTTYLRAAYLPAPHQKQVRSLLEEYVSTRLEAIDTGGITQAIKRSEELQDQLWMQAVAVAEKDSKSVMAGLFIQSLNEVIDLHAKRVNIGVRFRLPLIIWGVLYFVTILSMGSLGYQFGLTRARFTGISILLIFTFSTVLGLILDLDRPQEGFIRVSQQSLADLMKKFNADKTSP